MQLGQRATTMIDQGPFAGAEARVDQIIGYPIYALVSVRLDALAGPRKGDLGALEELYDLYLAEARPSWNLEDLRGPVPTTRVGMYRQPIELMVELVQLWQHTFPLGNAADAEPGVTEEPDGG